MKFSRSSLVRSALFTTLGLAAAAAFADPVIVNGSFELPQYAPNAVTSASGDGWTKSFMGPVSIINGQLTDGNRKKYGVTPFGTQYLGLDPRSGTGFQAADSQTIPGFVAGFSYVLTLFVADSDGGLAPQLEVELSNDAGHDYFTKVYDVPVGGPYGTMIKFHKIHAKFRSPVTGPITLSLRNVGTGTDPGSISIDNVSIATLGVTGPDDADTDTEADADVKPAASSSFQKAAE